MASTASEAIIEAGDLSLACAFMRARDWETFDPKFLPSFDKACLEKGYPEHKALCKLIKAGGAPSFDADPLQVEL